MKKRYLFYFLLVFLITGCSTQKNTWLSRSYHNLTARYNVLFNGRQSFDQGRESMQESLKDDFTNILPMFAFSEEGGGQVPSSHMTRAIQKGHKLIDKHSITAKPGRAPSGSSDQSYRDYYNQREFNRWVDEAWMLIGKSQVYSREWYEAVGAFQMVLQTFPDKNVRFEAMLWMARAYIEMDEFANARRQLQMYSSEVQDENQYGAEAMSTYAWFWLAQGEYDKALEYCIQASENAKERWQRIRWHFVLGQVAEKTEQWEVARQAYAKVVKLNPDYNVSIHAQIKSTLLEGGPDNPEPSRKELIRYAREYKNLEYRDQIYYALAKTWFWEGDTLNALTNLQLAAGYSGQNRSLAGNIYHRMADVYFHWSNYIAADAYYDSTLTTLPDDYSGIGELKTLKKKLEPLAESLKAIQHEDSVLRIAALPDEEREQFIDNMLIEIQQESEDAEFSDNSDDAFFYQNFANRGNRNSDESGKWYFYNQTMVSLGEMEFEKRWGRRDLADNWRRENKKTQQLADGGTDEMMPSDPFDGTPPKPEDAKKMSSEQQGGKLPDRESLIAGLPLSSEAMKISHRRVQSSLFNAGHVLSHNFEKHNEAVELFERLLRDYPETEYRMQALMGIYMACRKKNDRRCMQHYGKVITDDYPQSQFAEFVEDPDYFENQTAFRQEMEQLYADAYSDFRNGLWNSVKRKTEQVIDKGHDPLMPQAKLLLAVAESQSGNQTGFRYQLQQIVENYSQSLQGRIASHWLKMLDEGHQPEMFELALTGIESQDSGDAMEHEIKGSGQQQEQMGEYAFDPGSPHFVMLVVDAGADINQLMFHLANFNFDRITTGSLWIESRSIGSSIKVLETGPFENSKIGMDYFYSLINNPSVFKVNNAGEPVVLMVSESNRDKLDDETGLNEYKQFFLEKYLPGSDPSAIVINDSEIPDYSYVEEQIPGFSSVFSPNEGEVWGMIIVQNGEGDKAGAFRFLPNFSRSIVGYKVSVDDEILFEDTNILLLKSFKEISDFEEFKPSLHENKYWNSDIGAKGWDVYPISAENYQKLKEEEGDLEAYLEFLEL